MKDTLAHALELIAASEGGWSKNPKDPGGATMRGITLRTLSAYLGRSATEQELYGIPNETWSAIMTSQYADPIRYETLPPGLDYCALDTAVNSGPSRAAKLLQQAVGFPLAEMDGVIGHHTLDATAALTPDGVESAIRDFCAARLAYMKALKTWGTFGHGWKARVEAVQVEALTMADGRTPSVTSRDDVPETAAAKASGPTRLIAIPSGKAVLTTAGGAATTVGAAAMQVTTILQPHAGNRLVETILFGAALATAASTAVTVLITRNRSDAGATT
jgi:lysozyme family protein